MLGMTGMRFKDNGLDYEYVPSTKESMPLTDEEIRDLAEVSGKEKRALIKILKHKYGVE